MKNLKKILFALSLPFILNSNIKDLTYKDKLSPVYQFDKSRPLKDENGEIFYPLKADKNGFIIDKDLTEKKNLYFGTIYSLNNYVGDIKSVLDSKTPGPGVDYWQNPQETLERGKGNCSDKSIFLNDTLKKLNLDVDLVYSQMKVDSKNSHVHQEFEIGGDTFIIETTPKTPVIYNKRSLLKKYPKYLYKTYKDSSKMDYLNRKLEEYKKRNGVELIFSNLKKPSNR